MPWFRHFGEHTMILPDRFAEDQSALSVTTGSTRVALMAGTSVAGTRKRSPWACFCPEPSPPWSLGSSLPTVPDENRSRQSRGAADASVCSAGEDRANDAAFALVRGSLSLGEHIARCSGVGHRQGAS